LDAYGLDADVIPLDSFLGQCHKTGCCATTTVTSTSNISLKCIATRKKVRREGEACMPYVSISSHEENDAEEVQQKGEEGVFIREDIPCFQDIHMLRIYRRQSL
jgi:hypothetical protein